MVELRGQCAGADLYSYGVFEGGAFSSAEEPHFGSFAPVTECQNARISATLEDLTIGKFVTEIECVG